MKSTEKMPKDQETLKKNETFSLISSEKVEGTEVYTRRGDHLGEVKNVMIDKRSGKVAYAVVSFGGFLGMGEERRALPWQLLTYDEERDGYVVDAADEVLRNAPAGISEREYNDPEWGSRVYGHFGVTPYWR
ncbi:MAG: photosystem reaction center subunit H [Alphaproteobacteria bacterium]|nr:MAG: photosystem reaction center subunit H [Alphaproteobacteria bacterium]